MCINSLIYLKLRALISSSCLTKEAVEKNKLLKKALTRTFLCGQFLTENYKDFVIILKNLKMTITDFFSDPIFNMYNLKI